MNTYDKINSGLNYIKHSKIFFIANVVAVSIGVFLITTMMSVGLSIKDYIEKQFSKETPILAIEVQLDRRAKGAEPITQIQLEEFRKIDGVHQVFPHYVGIFSDLIFNENNRSLISLASLSSQEDPELLRLNIPHEDAGQLFDDIYSIIIPEDLLEEAGYQSAKDIIDKYVLLELTRIMAQKKEVSQIKVKIVGIAKKTRLSRCYGSIELLHLISTWQNWEINELPDTTNSADLIGKIIAKDTQFESSLIYAKTVNDIDRIQNTVQKIGYRTSSIYNLLKKYREYSYYAMILLGSLGAIALFAGSISIFNTTFASVIRRTREIGIYRAIGATSRQILSLFLWEAAITSFCAGTIGYFIAYVFIWLVNNATTFFQNFPLHAGDWLIFAIAEGVAVLSCIFAAIIPAIKAARLNPVESLRHE